MAQINPSKVCKECFVKFCDCTCETCLKAAPRNARLTKLELTRLNIAAGLIEAGVDPTTFKDTMKYGKGF